LIINELTTKNTKDNEHAFSGEDAEQETFVVPKRQLVQHPVFRYRVMKTFAVNRVPGLIDSAFPDRLGFRRVKIQAVDFVYQE